MNELIRRALLGNQDAQWECAKKGIAIPCPWCGKSVATKTTLAEVVCKEEDSPETRKMFEEIPIYACDLSRGGCGNFCFQSSPNEFTALLAWNLRTAPPIGRCGECEWYVPGFESEVGHIPSNCTHPLTELCVINEDDYCSYFEAREEKDNA